MKIFKKYRFPIYESILLNYLLLNLWLINNSDSQYLTTAAFLQKENLLIIIFTIVNSLILLLLIGKKIKPLNSPFLYSLLFFFIQSSQLYKLSDKYFWETIPDARTYKLLGENLLQCGELSLACNGEAFLQWPLGQPVISGILSLFFYEHAKYFYILLFSIAIYVVLKIVIEKFGNTYHFGAILFFLFPNNYELSGLIISEIPYLFFTSVGLFALNSNKSKLSLIFFIISFLIRPIGIVNLLGYLYFIFQTKEKRLFNTSIAILTISLFLVASYNLTFNGKFTISSTVTTNITNDAVEQNLEIVDFIINIPTSENLDFVTENVKRLYGAGSRDCVFSYCVIYNPLFKDDGTVPNLIQKNNVAGFAINILLSELFKIGSPLGIWVYLPFTYILLIRKKNNFDNLVIFLFFGNVFLSILTAEYGSRWWLLPNFLSIYLFSNLIYKIYNKVKNNLV